MDLLLPSLEYVPCLAAFGSIRRNLIEALFMKLEAKQVAILRHPETDTPVGKLYLWETGEVDPMWFDAEILDAIAYPLPNESPNWAKCEVVPGNWTVI